MAGSAATLVADSYGQRFTVTTAIALSPGTHHVRLVLYGRSAYRATSPDATIVIPNPPPAPPAPPAQQPLVPVASAGARTLAATRLRSGALRVPFAYRLVRACATPCRARIELRLRSGKQLLRHRAGRRRQGAGDPQRPWR